MARQSLAASCIALLGSGAWVAGFSPAPGSPVAVGKRPNGITAADLNGDGKLDLVTTNGGSSDVSVLLGDGSGRFRPAAGSPLAVSAPPHLAAASDLNGDRRPDLVVTAHDSHGVFVWLGDGRGRFTPASGSPFQALGSGKPHNHGLALDDLDGDGNVDVATTDDTAHCVAVLRGDGKGAFRSAPGSPFPVGREPYPLALADLDKDGRLDIVTPNVGGASLSVLLGDGRGFAPAPASPIAVTARPYFVALGDLNADGRVDAVVAHDDVSLVTLLMGDGRGGFKPSGSPLDVGRRPWKAVIHDMDRDGKLDVVLGAGGAVILLLGDGRGGFTRAPGSPFTVGRGAWSVAVGDLDGDGRPDIATADLEDDTVTVLLAR
jgi:hypothetical protein